MNFPPSPIPETNLTSWLARFHAGTRRLVPGDSETITARNTPSGVVYEINENALPPRDFVAGFELYTDGNGYNINSLVYVTGSKNYTDDKGTVYPSIPGVYICVSPVPPKVDTTSFDNKFLIEHYSKVTQTSGVVYAPVVVVNDTRALAYTTTDGKGKYWHLIAPAVMQTNNCQDGIGVTTYASAQMSPAT